MELNDISIDELELSTRTHGLLATHGFTTVGDIRRIDMRKFKRMHGVGRRTVQEVNELREYFNPKTQHPHPLTEVVSCVEYVNAVLDRDDQLVARIRNDGKIELLRKLA